MAKRPNRFGEPKNWLLGQVVLWSTTVGSTQLITLEFYLRPISGPVKSSGSCEFQARLVVRRSRREDIYSCSIKKGEGLCVRLGEKSGELVSTCDLGAALK